MKTLLMFGLLAVAVATHAAQIYEWVDEKGVKQYTQQPPPPGAKQVQEKRIGSNVIETSGPGYATQQAVKNFPVVVYITDCGEGCTAARAHMTKRGVPFTEKNPQQDFEAFKKLSEGSLEVPLLLVGALKPIRGYNTASWDAALDQAGYPKAVVPQSKSGPTPTVKPGAAPAPGFPGLTK